MRWTTVRGTITFEDLSEQVKRLVGVILTAPRHGKKDGELPPVRLHTLQKQGVFPYPMKQGGQKPGLFHPSAVFPVQFVVESLGLRYPEENGKRP